jgi:mannose-6-phosphate isomerase-like protein (cupin superfamily)
VAGVHVIRRGEGAVPATRHRGDILFTFVMEGRMRLEAEGQAPVDLGPGDAFVIPPGMITRYAEPGADLELLEVALPAAFETEVVER